VSLSAKNANQESREDAWRAAWPAIVRIIILEIVVLIALAGALVYYLNWSSDAAVSEFMAKDGVSIQSVKNPVPCDRSA
jgi:uncharacterized protein involved in cysteine biosynthesis